MFLFAVCQAGAEAALKTEVSRRWPAFRFSYSRPGFVTFRIPDETPADFNLQSTFVRTWAISLGRLSGSTAQPLIESFWSNHGDRPFHHLHVWERDRVLPGTGDFEPGPTVLASEIAELIASRCPPGRSRPRVNQNATAGDTVMDCVLVEPNEWWVGVHRAQAPHSRWPGGVCRITPAVPPISRSYYKMEEALRWSRLPIRRGDLAAEIGTAPGGSAQALLERGVELLGIDPAVVDERLHNYPQFRHLRKRAADMKRRDFRGVRWLFVDANVAPQSALDEIEPIVRHDTVHIRGMLLTLKLLEWDFADAIESYRERVRAWGFEYIRCRQLAYNRQEFCLAALRSRAMRRPPRRRVLK